MNQSCLSIISSQPRSFLFTSESVSEGHPDKMADQISDRILDAFLKCDPKARVACETVLADQFVLVAGEFKTTDPEAFDMVRAHAESIVRQTIRDIGYTSREDGIDPDECEIKIAFNHQSEHISQGVDQVDGVVGAGDQGLMFGYACNETPELMPLAISLAHKLVQEQSKLRKTGVLPWLRPDAKSQVSVRYVDGKPVAVEKVVLSTQHSPDISTEELRKAVREKIVEAVIPAELRSDNFEVLINPTGRFEVGGPNGDTGLTGRKIIVDTYGGSCPHGGGAFSGKDPSKVDRSAAYMARFIAKNIVAAGLATRCLVQLAYAIGVVEPVSVMVDTYGTGKQPDADLELLVRDCFNLTPRGIIITFDLEQQTYTKTATYGHFGRPDLCLPWEDIVKGGLAEIKASKEIDINREYISSWLWRSRRTREPVDIKTYKYWPSYPVARLIGIAAGAGFCGTKLQFDKNTTQDELLAEVVEKVMGSIKVIKSAFIDWSKLDRIGIEKTTHPFFKPRNCPYIKAYNCALYFSNVTKESLIEEAVKIAATWCPTACAVSPPEKVIWPEED